jgi:hypothetical protein
MANALRLRLLEGQHMPQDKIYDDAPIEQAVCCSVPAANTACHRLNAIIDELTVEGVKIAGPET